MKLGIDLAIAGYPARFYPDSKVISYFPTSRESVKSQRTRLEYGHLSTIITLGPKVLYKGIVKRDISLIALAFDLAILPLPLFAILQFLLLIVTFYFWIHSGYLMPLTIIVGVVLVFTLTILFAWNRYGCEIWSLTDLAYIPVYIAKKIPICLMFVFKRQNMWVKTDRKNNNDQGNDV
jgi:hypothetical protein